MSTKLKELYEAPTTMVLEVKIQGIVCQSQTDYIHGSLDEDVNDVMSSNIFGF